MVGRPTQGAVPGAPSGADRARWAYVADVAAVDWDNTPGVHELFALSGKSVETVVSGTIMGRDTVGGLWRSNDEGGHWLPVADSYGALGSPAPAYDDDSIDCPYGQADGGGLQLLPDELNQVLYVATHREHYVHGDSTAVENGVLLWDQGTGSLCEPDFGLPAGEQVSALAMVEGLVDAVPMLLVGYRSPGVDEPGLYACEVGDAFSGPDLTCASTDPIVCAPVEGTERWDVRDIEVHPATGRIYVSTGGADPTECMFDEGRVYGIEIDAFDSGGVLSGIDELTTAVAGFPSTRQALPGVSIDPSGAYLYAAVPGTEEGYMRLDLAAFYTSAPTPWERMGENATERPVKRANMDVGNGWLGGTELEREIYVPEVRDTERPIDLLWFTGWDNADHAAVYGWHTIWDVEGLNDPLLVPATESWWTLTPVVDNDRQDTWATVGPVDIEPDAYGNVWMAMPERHGFMSRSWKDTYPGGGHTDGRHYGAERSCLIERYGADGTSVSVGMDGTVWFSVAQSGATPPHDMGIWKRELKPVFFPTFGWETRYSFQGAGVSDPDERVMIDDSTLHQYNDVFCEWPSEDYEEPVELFRDYIYTGPLAKALGTEADTVAEPNGAFFNDLSTNGSLPSWGNPRVVAALDGMIAVAAFASYGSEEGRLAFTLDGGRNWEEIPVEVYVDNQLHDYSCGVMADFYDDSLSLTLLKRGTSTYWEDTNEDGVVDMGEWALDIMVGSSGNTDACMMARVQVAGSVSWDWYSNVPTEAGSAACRVAREDFDGLTGTAWSNEIFFWGGYRAESSVDPTNANGWAEYGGVCALDLDTSMITSVINPWQSDKKYEYQFADVAPSPTVADVLLVTGRQTPESVKACMQAIGAGPMSGSLCPSATPPLLVNRGTFGNYIVTPIGNAPGSDAGLAAAWGTDDADDMIYLATEHSGAWKGRVSW